MLYAVNHDSVRFNQPHNISVKHLIYWVEKIEIFEYVFYLSISLHTPRSSCSSLRERKKTAKRNQKNMFAIGQKQIDRNKKKSRTEWSSCKVNIMNYKRMVRKKDSRTKRWVHGEYLTFALAINKIGAVIIITLN